MTPLQYRRTLETFRWDYGFFDYFPEWEKHDKRLQELVQLQRELDPKAETWNKVVPPNFKMKKND